MDSQIIKSVLNLPFGLTPRLHLLQFAAKKGAMTRSYPDRSAAFTIPSIEKNHH